LTVVTIRHIAFVLYSAMRFGFSTRNFLIALVVVGGLVLLVLAIGAQAAAPFVLYPFA